MIITTIKGKTEANNIRFNQSIESILIISDVKLALETIQATIKDKNGDDIEVLPNLSITDLAEIVSREEGFHVLEADYSAVRIDIGYGGAIKLKKDQELVVELRKLNTTKEYKIFQHVGSQISNIIRRFEKKQLQAGDNSEQVNIANATRMFIKKSPALISVNTNYENTTSETRAEELEILNRMDNDVVSVSIIDGEGVFGTGDLLEIPEAIMAQNINITSNGDENITYYLEKPANL